MKKTVITAALLLCIPASYPTALRAAADASCAQLIPDLKFIHKQLAENSSNINYSTQTAKHAGEMLAGELALAADCKTEIDYTHSIKRYLASYHDHHLFMFAKDAAAKGTGLLVKKYDDRYFVIAKAPGLIAPQEVQARDELLSCDGKSPKTILEREILPLESYFDQTAALYENAYKLFWRSDVTGDTITCKFARGQQIIEAKLLWQNITDPDKARHPLANTRPLYTLENINGLPWITLRSMAPNNQSGRDLLAKFVEDAKNLRGEKKIVLDLRGNGGGNSSWGDRWFKNLAGYKPVQHDKTLFWASKDNLNSFIASIDKKLRDPHITQDEKEDYLKEKSWLQSKTNVFLDYSHAGDSVMQKEPGKQSSLYKGQIIVVTDYGCFSSCELFVKLLRSSGFATQVGIATDASTLFGEIRGVKTPSGLVEFSIPQKVFLNEDYKLGPIRPDVEIDYNIPQELNGDSIKIQLLQMIKNGKL